MDHHVVGHQFTREEHTSGKETASRSEMDITNTVTLSYESKASCVHVCLCALSVCVVAVNTLLCVLYLCVQTCDLTGLITEGDDPKKSQSSLRLRAVRSVRACMLTHYTNYRAMFSLLNIVGAFVPVSLALQN